MNDFLSGLKTKAIKYVIWLVISGGISFMGLVYGIYHAGEKHIQDKWDAANIKTEQEIKDLKDKADAATGKIEIQYVDRDKIIVQKGDTVIKYVEKYITKESDAKCVIPKNFILLHDAAALNVVPPGGEETK